MSLLDDEHDEMRTQPLLDDQTIESVLAGRKSPARPEIDELASFFSEVRSVAAAPAPKLGADLAAILANGLTTTDKGDLPAMAASTVTGPATQAAGLPKRRKSMIETIFASAAAKAAAVLAGLSLATTGAAAADVLPRVAQDRVAAAVEALTPLDLPDSADKRQDGEHRKDGDAADKAEDPSDQRNPNAEDNFGADVSNRARTTEDKGRDFGQSVSNDARERFQPANPGSQRPATTPTASNNPGTTRAPATTPTASNNPGTSYRESAPVPAPTPTADSNPGSAYRR